MTRLARHTPFVLLPLLLAAAAALAQPAPAGPAASTLPGPASAPGTPPPGAGTPPSQGPAVRPPPPGASGAAGVRPRRDARAAGPLSVGSAQAQVTLTGRVQQWLPNPNGDIDGLLLEDGTQVAFAPHLSARLLDTVKLRDTVQVSGVRGVPGAGSATPPVLRAQEIRNTASGTSVRHEPPAPDAAPPAPREPAALTAMNASGRIRTVLRNDRGDIDGVLLDNGTAVRFPPHVGAAMTADLQAGSSLYASGYGTRNTQGAAFAATRLGRSEATAKDVFTPPAQRP